MERSGGGRGDRHGEHSGRSFGDRADAHTCGSRVAKVGCCHGGGVHVLAESHRVGHEGVHRDGTTALVVDDRTTGQGWQCVVHGNRRVIRNRGSGIESVARYVSENGGGIDLELERSGGGRGDRHGEHSGRSFGDRADAHTCGSRVAKVGCCHGGGVHVLAEGHRVGDESVHFDRSTAFVIDDRAAGQGWQCVIHGDRRVIRNGRSGIESIACQVGENGGGIDLELERSGGGRGDRHGEHSGRSFGDRADAHTCGSRVAKVGCCHGGGVHVLAESHRIGDESVHHDGSTTLVIDDRAAGQGWRRGVTVYDRDRRVIGDGGCGIERVAAHVGENRRGIDPELERSGGGRSDRHGEHAG